MAAWKSAMQGTLIVLFAIAVVGIGAEELRRTTRKIKVNDASGQRMMRRLNPDQDFRKAELAVRQKKVMEESVSRAQLSDDTPEMKEKMDPTGLRALIHKLLP